MADHNRWNLKLALAFGARVKARRVELGELLPTGAELRAVL